MKKGILTPVAGLMLLVSGVCSAQVNTAINLWLKADAGTTPAAPANGASITAWASQQGGFNPTLSGSPMYVLPSTAAGTTAQNFFNYNPSLYWNGQYMNFSHLMVSSLSASSMYYVLNVADTTGVSYSGPGNFAELHNMGGGSTTTGNDSRTAAPFPTTTGTYASKFFTDDFGCIRTPVTGFPAGTSSNQPIFAKVVAASTMAYTTKLGVPFIYTPSNEGSGTNWLNRAYVNDVLVQNTTVNTANFSPGYQKPNYYFTTTPAVSIFTGDGATIGFNASYLVNYCPEILLFNADLTTDERSNVNSYLAIKYGITLSQSSSAGVLTPNNYTSSTSTTAKWTGVGQVIWNGNFVTYRFNIIGIGHDALTTPLVNQRQSKSVNTYNKGNILSISTQPLAATNAANTTPVSASGNSFFMVGDDDGATHSGGPTGSGTTGSNPVANTEFPAGVSSRIYREWFSQATNFTQNVTIGFDITKLGGYAPISNLRLLTDADGDFTNATIESIVPVVNPNYPDIIEFVGLTSSAYLARPYFTLASISSATSLPVELISFVAECDDEQVQLKWNVASEVDNDHFTVEASNDAISFDPVAEVEGRGTVSTGKVYTYDAGALRYKYYRLSQTDGNGITNQLGVIAASGSCYPDEFSIELYPNPLTSDADEISFYINATRPEQLKVQFYDMTGKLCKEGTIDVLKGAGTYPMDAAQLSKGVYTVRIFGHTTKVPALKFIRN